MAMDSMIFVGAPGQVLLFLSSTIGANTSIDVITIQIISLQENTLSALAPVVLVTNFYRWDGDDSTISYCFYVPCI